MMPRHPAGSATATWDRATSRGREKAALRSSAVAAAREREREGMSRTAAAGAVAAALGVTPATVRRWLARAAGDAALTPAALLVDRPKSGRPAAAWAQPGAEDAWRIWRSDYLRLEAPGAAACWRRVAAIGSVRGWRLPSAATFVRRLRAETRTAEVVRAREGRIAALGTHPAQTRTVAALRPLEIVSGDGYRHNLFVRLPSGRIGRPVSWVWQDVRTRRILALRSGETESADLVRLAFADVCREGVPEAVVVDNTRAASARWLVGAATRRGRPEPETAAGLFDLLGVRIIHTSIDRTAGGKARGRGQAKPVERAFGDLGEEIDRHPRASGAFAGRNPQAKPENYGSRALDWAAFISICAEGVRAYNARPGRRMEAAAGRSIDSTWAEEIRTAQVRRLTRAQAALLLLAAEPARVQRDGTFQLAAGRAAGLPANRYHAPELAALAGRQVVARFDPSDLHGPVEVHDLAGRWLATAECLLPVGFGDADAAREHARAQRRHLRALDQADRERERIDDLLDRAGAPAPPAPAPAEPKVVRPIRPAVEHPDAARRRQAWDRIKRGIRAG